MTLMISIMGIIFTILFVIGTHEAAHFMAARALSVKVLTFSIGFGKTLLRWHDKSGTEYVFALIPLGGYVKMLDENEGKVSANERHLAFNCQPFYKKTCIVLAGPAMNIFCAFVLYWLIFVIGFTTTKPIIGAVAPQSIAATAGLKANEEIVAMNNRSITSWTNIIFRLLAHLGDNDQIQLQTKASAQAPVLTHTLDLTHWQMDKLKPDPLASLGLTPYTPFIPLVIGIISPDSPAAASALKIGDTILAFNQQKIHDWQEISTAIYSHPNLPVTISVKRSGKTLIIPLTIGAKRDLFLQTHGILGIGPHFVWPKDDLRTVQYTPLIALTYAWQEIEDFTYFNFILFGKMFSGKLSLQSLGGPITIFETAGDALNAGIIPFISFLAFLSISIGIINLLPIPGLDGGHLFLQFIEYIIGKPIPERYLLLLFRAGFIFIIFILCQALLNDVLRIYS